MDFETLMRAKNELEPRVRQLVAHLDPERKALELEQIEEQAAAPGFWDDPEAAKPVLKARGLLTDDIATAKRLNGGLEDLETGLELSRDDSDMLAEAESVEVTLRQNVESAELRMMLSGDLDQNNAIVAIAPGAGGTESCDWASMLLRMYLRYCELKGWKTEMIDYQDGDEAGVKGATFIVSAPYAYGYLRAEAGVHRLVRISPFDSAKRRHTSFAAVYVSPELDGTIDVDIPDKDLRIDVFRASGAGGQHVNRTESAVRFTHLPTGLVVSCQNERSQIKNRATAMKVLQARLYEIRRREHEEKIAAASGEKSDVAWGSQIRSYVLQPYQMVKDHRTNWETSQTQKVLDGELDDFVRAQLLAKTLKTEGLTVRALVASFRFLTRIPVPGPETRVEDLAWAVGWFPLVGAAVGLGTSAVFFLAMRLWPAPVAAVLAIAFGLLLTGGFHEDGLTDATDGLGGGWTRERVLEIMKDSRIGAYGAMALWATLTLRWACLVALGAHRALWLLPLAMVWGRWSVCLILRMLPSISQGLAKEVHKDLKWGAFALATALLLLANGAAWHFGLRGLGKVGLAAIGITLVWVFYLRHRLGGHSGDTLGAGNQLAEAAALLAMLAG